MGDRRIAEIKTSEGSLFFYTHYKGHKLPDIAREALELAEPRHKIGDDSYALRRIVDHLIYASGSRDNELNSGLMFSPKAEDEYPKLVNLSTFEYRPTSVLIDMIRWRVEATDCGVSDCTYTVDSWTKQLHSSTVYH